MKYRSFLGFFVAILLLIVFVIFVGRAEVIDAILRVDLRIFLLGFGAMVFSLIFRGLVWILFIKIANDATRRSRIFLLFLSAMFIKYVTPYGQITAEPFIAYVVSEGASLEYEEGFAGIATADFLNYLPYFSFGLLGFLYVIYFARIGQTIVQYVLALGGLVIVVLGCTAIVLYKRAWVERGIVLFSIAIRESVGRISDRIRRRFERDFVLEKVDGFYSTIAQFGHYRRTLWFALAFAHIGMFFLILPIYITALAVGTFIPFLTVAFIIALSKIGALFPAPGGLGGIEVTIVASIYLLTPIGLVTATVIALLYRLCTYWFTVAIGGVVTIYLSVR